MTAYKLKYFFYPFILLSIVPLPSFSQKNSTSKFQVGFESLELVDKSRNYKPNTAINDKLHYRPVDLDIWYPTEDKIDKPLLFKDLFGLFEKRAINYQDDGNYKGITLELAQYYVSELELDTNANSLLNIKTNSFLNAKKTNKKHPVILYMAGFNGMGFENYKAIEKLVENGYIVVSIWSVGRYPGNMTNQEDDMMEQVLDAEFALNYLKIQNKNVDLNKIGVLACSWGGMSAGVLVNRNKNIKALVSFDGTETHYFGENETDDNYIDEIHKKNLLNPSKQKVKYLYIESGDKLQGFNPTKEYNYFKQINSKKFYLRFNVSKHSDFLCIPSILKASDNSVKIYDQISNLSLLWFNQSFRNDNSFDNQWNKITETSNTSEENYSLVKKNEVISEMSGQIIDAKTKEPLSYVNIGILHRETGTVSNDNGTFSLEIKEEFKLDTIRVSMIGFKPQTFLIKDIDKSNSKLIISLEEDLGELDTVVITVKALKKKTLGNKTTSKFISHLFYYGQLGKETGIKINIKKKPTYIDEFNFHISYNRFSAKALFRLNMYTLKDGKPDKNILKNNIIIPVDAKQTGLVTTDLRDYDIVASEDILVSLEWIGTEGKINNTEAIQISLGLLTGGTYERQSSQGEMKKILKGMGLGYTLKVRQ